MQTHKDRAAYILKHLNGNANRIRDNQRRSRARQKEHLKSLESKVRRCERLGIQASLEIQAAARAVLEENKHLKALLKSRGWSAPVSDDTTALQDQGRPLKSDAALLQEKLEKYAPCNEDPGAPLQGLQSSTLVPHYHYPSDPQRSFSSSSSDIDLGLESENLRGSYATSSTTNLNLCKEISLLDTSSCAFAVGVITDMRPDLATNEVKSSLECNESLAECRVENSRLFAAVDYFAD